MSRINVFIATVLFLIVGMNTVVAQKFVSTEPSLKNAVIEEFTGRNCHACPSGHKKSNELMRMFPGRVFTINIHEALTPETYPNFKTEDGRIIYYALTGSGIPNGLVNRCTERGKGTGQWQSYVYQETNSEAPCNIAGLAVVDEATRSLTLTVEIYYTKDVDVESNYLTIAMLQDSVWGSQNEGESNPEQYVDGNYCHMHTLRDIITDTWGDEISPTENGTLITKTYNYKIPEIIGDPNGVEVVLEHLDFIAFVTKDKTSEKSRPILNACRMPLLLGSQENVFPYFEVVTEKHNSFCDNNKTFTIDMMNRGLDEITSLKMLMEVDNGDTFEYEWNGNLASYDVGEIKFDMDVPIGTHDIDFKIVEANGQPFSYSKTIRTTCEEWTTIFVEHENDEIVLELMQDKFGNETTWKIITDDNTVLASGGPYEYYFGQTTATEFHEIPLQLPLNQCMKFVLSDQLGNGICCDYGDGYYRIIDGHGNVVVDGGGDFGYEASLNFTLEVGVGAEETAINDIKIYPNPAKDVVKVSTVNSQRSTVKVYNYLGILVEEIELDAEEIELDVSDYNPGIYFFNVNGKTVKVTIEN